MSEAVAKETSSILEGEGNFKWNKLVNFGLVKPLRLYIILRTPSSIRMSHNTSKHLKPLCTQSLLFEKSFLFLYMDPLVLKLQWVKQWENLSRESKNIEKIVGIYGPTVEKNNKTKPVCICTKNTRWLYGKLFIEIIFRCWQRSWHWGTLTFCVMCPHKVVL